MGYVRGPFTNVCPGTEMTKSLFCQIVIFKQIFFIFGPQAHHTKIWRFLDVVRADQNTNERHQAQLRAGHGKTRQARSQRYESSQNQLRIVVSSYEEYKNTNDIKGFLRSCAYHTKFGAVEATDESAENQKLFGEWKKLDRGQNLIGQGCDRTKTIRGENASGPHCHWTRLRGPPVLKPQIYALRYKIL